MKIYPLAINMRTGIKQYSWTDGW